jgi:hypothetical protein
LRCAALFTCVHFMPPLICCAPLLVVAGAASPWSGALPQTRQGLTPPHTYRSPPLRIQFHYLLLWFVVRPLIFSCPLFACASITLRCVVLFACEFLTAPLVSLRSINCCKSDFVMPIVCLCRASTGPLGPYHFALCCIICL